MSSDLTTSLQASELFEAPNVVALLASNAELEQETESKATREGLLETYAARTTHLAQFSSHHAKRLLRSTQEFTVNLTELNESESIAYARIDDALLGSYIIWYLVGSTRVVGCLYVIGKSEVPADAWQDLWTEK